MNLGTGSSLYGIFNHLSCFLITMNCASFCVLMSQFKRALLNNFTQLSLQQIYISGTVKRALKNCFEGIDHLLSKNAFIILSCVQYVLVWQAIVWIMCMSGWKSWSLDEKDWTGKLSVRRPCDVSRPNQPFVTQMNTQENSMVCITSYRRIRTSADVHCSVLFTDAALLCLAKEKYPLET